jgi:(p)ppGpp synthase/HD superfamily hydrolase
MSSSHLGSLTWLKQVIDTIIAGVLHDVVDDTGRDLRDVREHFGDEVAKLVA